MNVIRGKAVLTIERMDSEWVRYDVHAGILTCSGGWHGATSAQEDFGLLETDSLPLPAIAYKLEPGERATVNVSFEFHYSHGDGYTSDDDVDLYYNREYVLKRPKKARKDTRP